MRKFGPNFPDALVQQLLHYCPHHRHHGHHHHHHHHHDEHLIHSLPTLVAHCVTLEETSPTPLRAPPTCHIYHHHHHLIFILVSHQNENRSTYFHFGKSTYKYKRQSMAICYTTIILIYRHHTQPIT